MSTNDGMSRSRRVSATVGAVNTSDRPYQTMVLKRGCGELWRPDFSGKPNVIRIYPGLNPDNPTVFDPWRFSTRADDYGQWFFPVVVANVSCQASGVGRSWVLCHPLDNRYDMSRNPLVLMRKAVKMALDQKQPFAVNWLSLIQGGQGRGAELADPKESWLVQVALIEHKGNVYNPPRGGGSDDDTVFMLLPISAVTSVKSAMDQRKPEFRGDPDDIAGHFANGDPIAIEDGCFVVLFPRGKDPRNAPQNLGGFGQSRDGRGGGRDIIGYDCFLTKEWNGISANLSGYEDIVRSHVKNWEDVIHFPTDEEQVRYLEQVFRPYPDLLVYALEDVYGSVMDPSIRREGALRFGRARQPEVAPAPVPVAAPVAPQQVAPAAVPQPAPQAPVQAAKPRSSGFGAPSHRSSESIDPPTSTPGTSLPGTTDSAPPVVKDALVNQDDMSNALNLVLRARQDAMRGGSVPRPAAN
jgi:hypothetical protein